MEFGVEFICPRCRARTVVYLREGELEHGRWYMCQRCGKFSLVRMTNPPKLHEKEETWAK